MDKDNTSLTLFNNKLHLASRVSTSDLLELLEAMKRELIIIGNSSLLSTAFQRCSYYFFGYETSLHTTDIKYSSQTYTLAEVPGSPWKNMSAYNAWMLICKLAEYLLGKDITLNLKMWQQHFSQPTMVPKGTKVEELWKCLKAIDDAVLRARRKAFSRYTDESPEDVEMVGSNASENARSKIDALLREAEEKAAAMIANASAEAGRLKAEAEKTLAAAQNMLSQADAARASAEAACAKTETARAQVSESSAVRPETAGPKHPAEISPRQELRIEDSLAELRRALMDTNAQMRKLEDSILESGRDETIRQLLELYNLIADFRDSVLESAGKAGSLAPQNVERNLNEFLKMIAGFMTSYGVTVHTGAPGDPFNVRTQEVRNSPAQYDPRRAVISACLRSGFALDEVVLQKERVRLKEPIG